MASTLPDSRVLVALAPLGRGRSGGALTADGVRLPVGVAALPDRMIIVVKVTFRYDPSVADQTATIAPQQRPLYVAEPNGQPGAGGTELNAAHDFAHFKPQTDVLLQGGAFAAQAQSQIAASCVVTSQAPNSPAVRVERVFSALGGSRVQRIPLLGGYLREPDGETLTEPVGPAGPWFINNDDDAPHSVSSAAPASAPRTSESPPTSHATGAQTAGSGVAEPQVAGAPAAVFPSELFDNRLLHNWAMLTEPEVDYENPTSFAAAKQRSPLGSFLSSDAMIDMSGLAAGGERCVVRLPGYHPMLVCETKLDSYAPQTWLDTLTINTDDNTVVAVWRASFPLLTEQPSFEVKRVIVTLEPEREPRPLGVVYRDLQRGDFFRAWEEQDVRGSATDWEEEEEDLELEMERYDAFDLPSEPTISIEHYAQVCAELAAAEQPRPVVLARHDHTEDSWLLEDQGWIEKIGNAVMAGDPSLSESYTKLYWAQVAQLEEGTTPS